MLADKVACVLPETKSIKTHTGIEATSPAAVTDFLPHTEAMSQDRSRSRKGLRVEVLKAVRTAGSPKKLADCARILEITTAATAAAPTARSSPNPSGNKTPLPACRDCGGRRPVLVPDYDCEPWPPRSANKSGQILAKGARCYPCFWAHTNHKSREEWPHWSAFHERKWKPTSRSRYPKPATIPRVETVNTEQKSEDPERSTLEGRSVRLKKVYTEVTLPTALRPYARAEGVIVNAPKVVNLAPTAKFKVQLQMHATGKPLDVMKVVQRRFFSFIEEDDDDDADDDEEEEGA